MNTSKQINIIVALIFASLIATGAYWMWDPDRADDAEARQLETTIERGAFLFSQNCRVCHGDSGEGGQRANRLREAPALNRPDLQGIDAETGEVVEQTKRQQYRLILNTMNCGRVGTAMPTWGQAQGGTLSDEQMRQLAVFITEGTGWEHAAEFALEGFPPGEVHGDADVTFGLTGPIGEEDTTITLSPNAEGTIELSAGDRLEIGSELIGVVSIDEATDTISVERGVGSTQPAAHEADATILKRAVGSAVPAEPVAIVQAACGQTARPVITATPEPPAADVTITSQGIAFDKVELFMLPGVPLTVNHVHNDPGQQHNFALYTSEDAALGGEAAIAATDIVGEPQTQVLNFGPLEIGEYYYQCDVHTAQMNGILYVQEPTAADAAGGDAAAAETPAPADGAAADGAAADTP